MSVSDIFAGPIAYVFVAVHDAPFILEVGSGYWDIGKTRSRTIVEYKPNQTIEEFTQEFISLSDADKFDVYSIYQWLYVRAKDKYRKQPKEYEWWVQRMERIGDLIDKSCLEQEKLKTNSKTSYEMVQFGKEMVTHFWRQI